MRFDTFAMPNQLINKEYKECTVIIIDVLRATSSMITALENGCREVVPVAEIDDAVSLARTLGDVLLCGERGADRIPGFHLSNSPLEYTPERVAGNVLIMTTTNGTRAILRAKEASRLLLGAFLNATAVAQAALETGKDVILLCSGTGDRFSTDDILAAGAILERMVEKTPDAALDDLSRIALFMYRAYKAGEPLLEKTVHYQRLMDLGYEEDVRFCLREDAMQAVPEFRDGVVRLIADMNRN